MTRDPQIESNRFDAYAPPSPFQIPLSSPNTGFYSTELIQGQPERPGSVRDPLGVALSPQRRRMHELRTVLDHPVPERAGAVVKAIPRRTVLSLGPAVTLR